MGTWWPGINWGSSPPSCDINGYLVLTGEANANCPCLTQQLKVQDCRWTLGAHTFTCGTRYSLLRVTGPALPALTPTNTRVVHKCPSGRRNRASTAAEGFACACVRACVCGSQFDAQLCQIGDNLVTSWLLAQQFVSLSKKLYSHCSSLPSCLNGDLVAWCQLGKQPTQL